MRYLAPQPALFLMILLLLALIFIAWPLSALRYVLFWSCLLVYTLLIKHL